MNELHARTKPATASNRFRALQQIFKFAVEEEEIDRSPMERMQRPTVPSSRSRSSRPTTSGRSWPRARASTSRTSGTSPPSALPPAGLGRLQCEPDGSTCRSNRAMKALRAALGRGWACAASALAARAASRSANGSASSAARRSR